MLWHAYPVIGIDDRNQFDYYRDVPGLAELVAELQRAASGCFLDYNPWDIGTRREPTSDAEALAALVAALGADGVFLDTMQRGRPRAASRRCDALARRPVLEGESRVPLERIGDHQMSWAQWFADSRRPACCAAHWFERRHMQHHTRRWNRDHSDELHSAWINGTGMVVWDVVFGSGSAGTSATPSTLRRMARSSERSPTCSRR